MPQIVEPNPLNSSLPGSLVERNPHIPVWFAILVAKNIWAVGSLSYAEKCSIDKIIDRNLSLSGSFGISKVDQFIVEI